MPKNPCYDSVTHTDCPRRKVGCAIDCPDWAKHIAERDEMYKKRAEYVEGRSVRFDTGPFSNRDFKRIVRDKKSKKNRRY